MYVDDTDLLHWADSSTTTDEELIEKVQWELDVWADIVNDTRGILKAIKCLLFLLTYKWHNGRPSLKTAGQLPSSSHEIVMRRDPPDPNEDLSNLTMDELRDRLREERLNVSGKN